VIRIEFRIEFSVTIYLVEYFEQCFTRNFTFAPNPTVIAAAAPSAFTSPVAHVADPYIYITFSFDWS
jgi:hypothetical protein